jgi:hypothetical protein
MKLKTSELQGAVLDWAVAKCEVTVGPLLTRLTTHTFTQPTGL